MTEFKFKESQLKWLIKWMNERHAVYLSRAEGNPFPWTKDKILCEYKFTNVFRQLDRVTVEWINRYAKLSSKRISNADAMFHCIMFRIFNWPETYDALKFNMNGTWNKKQAIEILRKRKEEDFEKIFTGAYIVTGGGKDQPKHETICEALQFTYDNRESMCKSIMRANTMERTVEILSAIPTVGPFVAYEMACDLRFTRILADARDVLSWTNPGPGAKRGINRLLTGSFKWDNGKKPDYVQAIRQLYKLLTEDKLLNDNILNSPLAKFEMREVEHSLCEYDKYMRVKLDEGRPRSRFRAPVVRDTEVFGDEE